MSFGMMTQKELIELIQQHHPAMNETECRMALNRAQSQFGSEAEAIEDVFTDTIVTDQRYYKLADSNSQALHPIISIKRVDVDGEVIPRLIGNPPTIDTDGVES